MASIMNDSLFLRVFLVFFFLTSHFTIYAYDREDISDLTRIEDKTLDRYVDPLIIEGTYLPTMIELPIDGLRLYSHQDQGFVPIPFQIDEVTEDGYKVLPEGPQGNPEKANHVFDKQDELLFMAFDTGDKVKISRMPLNCPQFIEIEINDPLNHKKGWVYLLYFDISPPPPSTKYYCGKSEKDWSTGYEAVSPYMTIGGKQITYKGKTYNQVFYDKFTTPVSAGGTGVDYIDRLKWHVEVGFLFNTIKVSFDEDNLIGDFLCWKTGPIRGTSRVWAAAKLPFGLKSPRFVADVVGYDKSISTSTVLNVPFNPGYVITEITTRIGTDLSPEAYGMRFFNSENLQGFKIDGHMSTQEESFNPKRDTWRIITGPQGTVMNRSTWSENFLSQAETVEVGYLDDIQSPDPPESLDGQIGHSYSLAKMKKMKPGTYNINIEWYWPSHFYDPKNPDKINLEVVNHYLNFQDNPLQFLASEMQGINKTKPAPAQKWK